MEWPPIILIKLHCAGDLTDDERASEDTANIDESETHGDIHQDNHHETEKTAAAFPLHNAIQRTLTHLVLVTECLGMALFDFTGPSAFYTFITLLAIIPVAFLNICLSNHKNTSSSSCIVNNNNNNNDNEDGRDARATITLILICLTLLFTSLMSFNAYSPIYDLSGVAFFIMDLVMLSGVVLNGVLLVRRRHRRHRINIVNNVNKKMENVMVKNPTMDLMEYEYEYDLDLSSDMSSSNETSTQPLIPLNHETPASQLNRWTRILASVLVRYHALLLFTAWICVKSAFFFKWSSAHFLNDYAESVWLAACLSVLVFASLFQIGP